MPQGFTLLEEEPKTGKGFTLLADDTQKSPGGFTLIDKAGQNIPDEVIHNSPEYIAQQMGDPNFVPTMNQFQQYKKYENDVPWADVLDSTVDYFGELLSNGVSDLAKIKPGILGGPEAVGTITEAFMQGNRGLYQIIAQSQDPNSWAFKTKKALIESNAGIKEGGLNIFSGKALASPVGALLLDVKNAFKGKKVSSENKEKLRNKAEYMQFILAREWAKETLKLEKGETNLIGEALHSYGAIERDTINKLPIRGQGAALLGMGFDVSTFAGGAVVTAPGKAMAKNFGKAVQFVGGKGLKPLGQATGEGITNVYKWAADKVAKAAPDVDKATTEAALAAATGTSKIRMLGQVAGLPGEAMEALGESMARGPSRVRYLRQIQEDLTKSAGLRRAAWAAEVSGAGGLATGVTKFGAGALGGAAIGGGLGAWTEGREGFIGGSAAGGALGAAGGVFGRTIGRVTGGTKKAKLESDWNNYLGRLSEDQSKAVTEYAGDKWTSREKVMDLTTFTKGVSGQDVEVRFLWGDDFNKIPELRGEDVRSGAFMKDVTEVRQEAAGAHLIQGEKPTVLINLDYEGPRSLAHEVVHAMGALEGMQSRFNVLENQLIGQRLPSGEKMTKGLLDDAQVEASRKAYRDKLSEANKDKFDKLDEGVQNRNMVEEIAADYFANLIDKGKSDLLLKTEYRANPLTREFWRGQLDKALLNEADGKLSRMRTSMLRGFGEMFEPVTGKINSDFVGADGKPVSMSAEVNAALREMIRAKKSIRQKMDIHNDPNRFILQPRDLTQAELNKLGNIIGRTRMLSKDKSGNWRLKDDATLMEGEVKLARNVVEALEQAGDQTDPAAVQRTVTDDGNVIFTGGKFTEAQLTFIDRHPDIDPEFKKTIREVSDEIGTGNQILIDYYAATKARYRKSKTSGKRYRQAVYSSGIKGRSRHMVPYSFEVTKAGNFLVRSLDVTQMEAKLEKMSKHLDPWGRNREAFWDDVLRYARNLDEEAPKPSAELFGKEKRNILNQFFNARGREGSNPLAFGKSIKDKDFLIRSFRLDRITRWEPKPDRDFIPFHEDAYRLNQVNFMPKGDVSTWHRKAVGDVQENLRLAQARRPETGVAKNPAVRFHDEEGKPIYVGAIDKDGGKPYAGWAEETKTWLSSDEISSARQWYRELKGAFEKIFGKRKAGRMMMSWLGAQQNASPLQALGNVFRVLDRLDGIVATSKEGKQLKGGLADEKIQQILTGKLPKKGFGPKLSDFVDSAYLRKTRTFMGGSKKGGQPFVADVHTGRDSGHVDHTTLSRLVQKSKEGLFIDGKPVKITTTETKKIKTKVGGVEKVQEVPVKVEVEKADGSKFELDQDMIGSPGSTQYEGISVWGNNLTDWLNKQNFDGGKWTPAEAQAVGWMRILRQYGLPESTVTEAVVANTHRVSAEVNYDWSQAIAKHYPKFDTLPQDVQTKITRDVLTKATKDVAEIVGGSFKTLAVRTGVGYWEGAKSPSVQIFALASAEAAALFRDGLALASEQGGAISVQFGKGGKQKRAVKFKRTDGVALTEKQIQSFVDTINGDKKSARLMKGFSAHPTPDEKGLLFAGLTGASEAHVKKVLTDWMLRHRIDLDVDGLSAVTEITGNDWTVQKHGEGYLSGIERRGGSERARQLYDYRATYLGHLEKAFQEHAPGLLDPAQTQSRIESATAPLKNSQKAPPVIPVADPFVPRGKAGKTEVLENSIGWRIVKTGKNYKVYKPDGAMAGVGKSIEAAQKIANKKIGQ